MKGLRFWRFHLYPNSWRLCPIWPKLNRQGSGYNFILKNSFIIGWYKFKLQGYPQKMELQIRLYRICTICFGSSLQSHPLWVTLYIFYFMITVMMTIITNNSLCDVIQFKERLAKVVIFAQTLYWYSFSFISYLFYFYDNKNDDNFDL